LGVVVVVAAAATVVVAVIWVCAIDSHQMVMCCKNGQKRNFGVRQYLLTTQDGLVGEIGEMVEMLRCCTDPFCGITSSSCHTTSRVSDNVCRLSCDSPTCICLPSLVFFSFFILSFFFFFGFVFAFSLGLVFCCVVGYH
jgi:hypothetical protein